MYCQVKVEIHYIDHQRFSYYTSSSDYENDLKNPSVTHMKRYLHLYEHDPQVGNLCCDLFSPINKYWVCPIYRTQKSL